LNKKRGDRVEVGDVLATIHANNKYKLAEAKKRLLASYTLPKYQISNEPIIKTIIE